PLPLWQTKIIHHPHRTKAPASQAAVIKGAPKHLAAAPGKTPGTGFVSVRAGSVRQVAPPRRIFAGTIRHGGTVFGNNIRNSWIGKQSRAISVVARNIAELVNSPALATANGRGSGRVQFMRITDQFLQKVSHLRHHGFIAEENFVIHAPNNDARVIPIDADHITKAGFHARLETGVVSRIRGICAGSPWAFETAGAPKTIFRPEQHSELVACRGECWCVRVMRTPNEIKPGALDQFHIAEKSAVGHGVAPAGVILMHVGALKIIMFAVQKKSVLSGEFEPAETEWRSVIIHGFASIEHDCLHRI